MYNRVFVIAAAAAAFASAAALPASAAEVHPNTIEVACDSTGSQAQFLFAYTSPSKRCFADDGTGAAFSVNQSDADEFYSGIYQGNYLYGPDCILQTFFQPNQSFALNQEPICYITITQGPLRPADQKTAH